MRRLKLWEIILVPVLFYIIITGFIGNLLVVCVVALNKNMMNTTNLLILNLAVRAKSSWQSYYGRLARLLNESEEMAKFGTNASGAIWWQNCANLGISYNKFTVSFSKT